jgi:hypothetical protein
VLTGLHPPEPAIGCLVSTGDPCCQMVAATFGGSLGGTLGHKSVAGKVAGGLGYRRISPRKALFGTRPRIIYPIFRDCA